MFSLFCRDFFNEAFILKNQHVFEFLYSPSMAYFLDHCPGMKENCPFFLFLVTLAFVIFFLILFYVMLCYVVRCYVSLDFINEKICEHIFISI